MKRKIIMLMAFSTIAGATGAAHAQDVDWSGGYVGVDTSLNWAQSKSMVDGFTQTNDLDGPALGGFAGYNFQFDNNFVVGVEGELSFNWNEKKTYHDNWIPMTEKVGTNWQGGLGARAGYAWNKALIYGKAGWASTEITNSVNGLGTQDRLTGWSIGAGVDYAVSEKIFARLQYDYIDFGKQDFLGEISSGFAEHPQVELTQNRVMIGLGARF